jgi:ATP-dependent RNA circularization protein (DNA/RNA ligase family)
MRLYPKIPHLPNSRTGIADKHIGVNAAKRFLEQCGSGEQVVVQEKLDGSCVIITRHNGQLLALGRDGRLCANSMNPLRTAFATWTDQNTRRFDWLKESERLILEWLAVAHGTRYVLPHEPIVALDFFNAEGVRFSHVQLQQKIVASQLPVPRVLHIGNALPLPQALDLLGEYGHHGATDPAEGVIYRLEQENRVLMLAKYVRHTKQDGLYLADHTGLEEVWNSWKKPNMPS